MLPSLRKHIAKDPHHQCQLLVDSIRCPCCFDLRKDCDSIPVVMIWGTNQLMVHKDAFVQRFGNPSQGQGTVSARRQLRDYQQRFTHQVETWIRQGRHDNPQPKDPAFRPLFSNLVEIQSILTGILDVSRHAVSSFSGGLATTTTIWTFLMTTF